MYTYMYMYMYATCNDSIKYNASWPHVYHQGRRKPFEFGTVEYEYKLQSRSKTTFFFCFRAGQRSYVELLRVEGVILIIARMTFDPS